MKLKYLSLASLLVLLVSACGVTGEEPFNNNNADTEDHSGHNPDSTENAVLSGETIIDASSTSNWAYWDFSSGAVVTPADPSTSHEWDMAFRRAQIAANCGTTHMMAGHETQGGVMNMATTDWAGTTECPAEGYEVDEMMPIPGPPGSGEYSGNPALADWFDYDPATHAVSSKSLVYCIRTADGKYAKFTIINYAGGQMTIRWEYQPDGSRSLP
ncbi:MAG: HmuY family protein [Deltaproteobacteria bacterium]|nr:HmuY family protein [Deltaproteobacteria bacterium]